MTKAILALNAGSSSIKFAAYRVDREYPGLSLICRGLLDRHASSAGFTIKDAVGKILDQAQSASGDQTDPMSSLLPQLQRILGKDVLTAVGHRIVHGGARFSAPILIQGDVLQQLDALTPLAPLHQPACLAPIRVLQRARPELAQVACFDTAFHRDMPSVYKRLPIPDIRDDIHRYGFHGLSFEYVAAQIGDPQKRTVIAHLGNGSSVCALQNGRSINTSMSLTPLDGLMMATRSGAIDPGLLLYLLESKGLSTQELKDLLYRESGLVGVSGVSSDMRTLLSASDQRSRLAVDQFCARAAEYIAVMAVSLGGLDRLVFTGGIGENSSQVRSEICYRIRWLGIELEEIENERSSSTISRPRCQIKVQVAPTDEEAMIAKHILQLLPSQL
ncbi:acetate/propionate family kinase [Bradyrhizobium ivorense]|uniref:acetate/propionate family kinase n=1 Tax=Bradyrhizobium ivorense TaxID=2511166 RepID=UPI0010B9135E|nr:acetate/propionate family kinase [Bradyrhizobium ivorense]VIO67830.1 putative propionate kinase [Bradyrhizobium ivorense]